MENVKHLHNKLIISYPKFSYLYAYYVLKGPFSEGEPAIAKHVNLSYRYACEVLHGRFELGEELFSQSPSYASNYAIFVLKTRFPLGEPAIATDAYFSCSYAQHICGPFPPGEPEIAKYPHIANNYTQLVLCKDFMLDGKLIKKYTPTPFSVDSLSVFMKRGNITFVSNPL